MATALPASPSLIVCATLVQNPMNLGGLCRTCEVLGVNQLVLAELSVADSSAFRRLAASGQQWQPLASCSLAELPAWLIGHRQAGYETVALTAQPAAQSLMACQFKPRTVLLLGRELTGIPADITALCDRAVTIPQAGRVGSLNVQTAAAIAVYEYRRQYPR
ncbi:MAG: RNA methyltransferase [Leptolyngbya sp. SIO4C1]|nr:RNA methyltransferase [Leptolyngbya sp. SIO4C1]